MSAVSISSGRFWAFAAWVAARADKVKRQSGSSLDNESMTNSKSRTVGIAAAIITVFIWTAFVVIGRASAKMTLSPLDVVFCRMLGAGLMAIPWGIFLVNRMRRLPHETNASKPYSLFGLSPLPLRQTLILGVFGGLCFSPLAYTAFTFAPAAHGAVLMPGTLPLSTALFAMIILNERFSKQRALGLALIACGGILVGGISLLKAFQGGTVWIGDVLFVCASSTWAMYSVLARKYKVDAVEATIAFTVFAVLCYVPLYGVLAYLQALPFGLTSHLADAPRSEVMMQMLMQGVGSGIVGNIGFTLMLKHFGPVRTTMMTALVPSLSALSAVYFLDEPLYWNLIAGLALALTGVILGITSSAKK
jgi:drug/metabolite transporter (DMT)-like permease